MRLIGLFCVLGGWAVTLSGLFLTTAVAPRMFIACLGIGISLYGSLGILNGYYLERAIWKQ